MSDFDFADKVVAVVERYGPIKAVDLGIKLVHEFGISAFHEHADAKTDDRDLVDLIEKLVKDKRIIEVEYVIHGTHEEDGCEIVHRVKSMLFPAGTEIRVRGVSK